MVYKLTIVYPQPWSFNTLSVKESNIYVTLRNETETWFSPELIKSWKVGLNLFHKLVNKESDLCSKGGLFIL